jgi:hypothetical protein
MSSKAEQAPSLRTCLWGSSSAERERYYRAFLDSEVSWGYLVRTSLLYALMGGLEVLRTHSTRPGGCQSPLPVHGAQFGCYAIAAASAYRLAAALLLLFLGSRRIKGNLALIFIRVSPLVLYSQLCHRSLLPLSPEDDAYRFRHYTQKALIFNLLCDAGAPAPFYQVRHMRHMHGDCLLHAPMRALVHAHSPSPPTQTQPQVLPIIVLCQVLGLGHSPALSPLISGAGLADPYALLVCLGSFAASALTCCASDWCLRRRFNQHMRHKPMQSYKSSVKRQRVVVKLPGLHLRDFAHLTSSAGRAKMLCDLQQHIDSSPMAGFITMGAVSLREGCLVVEMDVFVKEGHRANGNGGGDGGGGGGGGGGDGAASRAAKWLSSLNLAKIFGMDAGSGPSSSSPSILTVSLGSKAAPQLFSFNPATHSYTALPAEDSVVAASEAAHLAGPLVPRCFAAPAAATTAAAGALASDPPSSFGAASDAWDAPFSLWLPRLLLLNSLSGGGGDDDPDAGGSRITWEVVLGGTSVPLRLEEPSEEGEPGLEPAAGSETLAGAQLGFVAEFPASQLPGLLQLNAWCGRRYLIASRSGLVLPAGHAAAAAEIDACLRGVAVPDDFIEGESVRSTWERKSGTHSTHTNTLSHSHSFTLFQS